MVISARMIFYVTINFPIRFDTDIIFIQGSLINYNIILIRIHNESFTNAADKWTKIKHWNKNLFHDKTVTFPCLLHNFLTFLLRISKVEIVSMLLIDNNPSYHVTTCFTMQRKHE